MFLATQLYCSVLFKLADTVKIKASNRVNSGKLSVFYTAGLAELYRKTGLPVVAHNRYWAVDNVYAAVNNGGYAFITEAESQRALPDDINFWPDLFNNNSDWGLAVYEQGGTFLNPFF
jgi:hypothetical protein